MHVDSLLQHSEIVFIIIVVISFYLLSTIAMAFSIPDQKRNVHFKCHAFKAKWNAILTYLLIIGNIYLFILFFR